MSDATEVAAAASSRDPAVGLAAVASLRRLLESLEELQVRNARAQGWSWQQIADALGSAGRRCTRSTAGPGPRQPGRTVDVRTVHRDGPHGRRAGAAADARERGDGAIDTGHLLRALYAVPDNLAARWCWRGSRCGARTSRPTWPTRRRPAPLDRPPDAEALAALGIDLDEVRRQVEEAFGPGALDRARAPRGTARRAATSRSPGGEEGAGAGAARGGARCGTTTSAPSTCCSGCCTATGAAQDVLVARGVRLDAARVIVEELVRGRRRAEPGRVPGRAACEHRRRAHRRRHDLPRLPRAAARGAARPGDRARAGRARGARPARLDPRRAPGRRRRPVRRRPGHGRCGPRSGARRWTRSSRADPRPPGWSCPPRPVGRSPRPRRRRGRASRGWCSPAAATRASTSG